MLVTNLIEPTTLQNVLEGRAPGALPPSLPLGGVGGVPPHMHHGVYPPPVAALPPVAAAIIPPLYGMGVGGGAAMPPSVYMQQPQVPLPQQQPLQPPPPPPPPTQQQLGLSASQIEALPDQQKILLMQVLSLTPQQIAAMSPVEQEQVKALVRKRSRKGEGISLNGELFI